ncbi:MAG TPA: TIGR03936 family radical SAM-associated protein, partial [Gemmataceae bacterium]|nr:TIGR03936 family radical SAM-associated protein [Gemmataceae bacterium]
LMRSAERLLRRADVPFKSTGGFHPTPRLVFALSLPLGVVGLNEVVELELTCPHDADELRARLNQHAPAGLTFSAAKVVEMAATAVPRRAVYRMPLPPGRCELLGPSVAGLLSADKVWADRLRPKPRRVNVRPYIRDITTTADAVELDLWVTSTGTARADELIQLLGLGDVLDSGAVPERTDLEIHDEVPPGAADAPPAGPPETAPLEHVPADAADEDGGRPAEWGLSPNGPVVE